MTDDGTLFIWNKGESGPLSPHFDQSEFTCNCEFPECVEQKIEKDLINRLEKLRDYTNSVIRINSGYRCQAYQNQLIADKASSHVAPISTHTAGKAADIAAPSLIIAVLISAIKLFFNSYGTARNWCHVDTRPPHDDGTPRTWTY